MDIYLISAIVLVLLVLFWLALGRGAVELAGAPDRSGVVRLPPRSIIDRCFSEEDLEFAMALRSPGLLHLYEHERRRLALAWLHQTRREAGRLVRSHLNMARHAGDIRPGVEAKILLQMAVFLFVCQLLVLIVSFYGPFRTRRVLQSAHGLAEMLSGLGGRLVISMAPDVARAAQ